jgi:UDP-N-acetylglucosamine acyltransferase
MTPIHQFVKIGDLAMIAGASALSQDVPPFCLAEGNRAVLRGLNLTGLRRALPREAINPLRFAYKELFERGKPLKETAEALLRTAESEEVKKSYTDKIPLKRFGDPKDVAEAVAFLLSDSSSYITGEILKVNGGMYV